MLKKLLFVTISLFPLTLLAEELKPALDDSNGEPITVVVEDSRVALTDTIGTYNTPASVLRYEPLVDLQARNMPEAQGDVAIRGGIFKNSGFNLNGLNLWAPQTGHYSAEIPISPFMLSYPEIRTGFDNSLLGFNSSVGSVAYGLMPVKNSGRIGAEFGDNDLNTQQIYSGFAHKIEQSNNTIGFDIDLSRSESDGTVSFGDHEFERVSGRFQFLTPNTQTDLFAGYQDKYLSWPSLYVVKELHDLAGSSGIESEALESSLFGATHVHNYGENSTFQVGAYYRRNKDDYEFDRFSPGLFNPFEHETDVMSAGFNGHHELESFTVVYSGQFLADEIESTALTAGEFTSRTYRKLSVAPKKTFNISNNQRIMLSAGAAYDDTNRDSDAFSPLAEVRYTQAQFKENSESVYLQYSKSTQVPGYTAIASSAESGLFRGNQNLRRERAHNIEAGIVIERDSLFSKLAAFYRDADDLVDWTFDRNSDVFASRFANNVDIETFGIESLLKKAWSKVELILSYTYLRKSEDYGIADVDASFYALNFPRHRATTSIVYKPIEQLSIRMDNEFRSQVSNPIRISDEEAFFSSASIVWSPIFAAGAEAVVAADNLWNENFDEIPGVPGHRRQFAAGVRYRW